MRVAHRAGRLRGNSPERVQVMRRGPHAVWRCVPLALMLAACGGPDAPPAIIDAPPQAPPILLQGALTVEIDSLLAAAQPVRVDTVGRWTFAHGMIEGVPVVVSRTQMGVTNAAAATTIAIERYHPRAIINTGTAGGHDSTLHVGDVVLGASAVSIAAFHTPARALRQGSAPLAWIPLDLVEQRGEPEGAMHEGRLAQFPADSALLAVARRAIPTVSGVRVVEGVIGSGEVWNEERDRIAAFHTRWRTSVEEMETASVAQVAAAYGVPFLGVRVVTANATNNGAYDAGTARLAQRVVLAVVREYVVPVIPP